jgi:hypothetical protein
MDVVYMKKLLVVHFKNIILNEMRLCLHWDKTISANLLQCDVQANTRSVHEPGKNHRSGNDPWPLQEHPGVNRRGGSRRVGSLTGHCERSLELDPSCEVQGDELAQMNSFHIVVA